MQQEELCPLNHILSFCSRSGVKIRRTHRSGARILSMEYFSVYTMMFFIQVMTQMMVNIHLTTASRNGVDNNEDVFQLDSVEVLA